MKRICHVQVLPILSGVQRAMLEMFKQLDRQRYEIHVACQAPGPLTEELERQDVIVHLVPSLVRALNPVRDLRAYHELAALFRRQRFDLVHTHSSKPGMVGRLAARRANVPVVLHHVHAFAFHEHSPRLKRFVYSRLERWASSFCDRLLFVNREERDWVVQTGWLPAARCHTIYNGVDLKAFRSEGHSVDRQQVRQRWGLRADELAIVFIGRLDYPKQPLLLPAIAAELDKLRPAQAWRLLIAGDGPKQAQVRQQIARLNLNRRVELLGWQNDPSEITSAADVVLLTSLAEGLPVALIEAQAAAKPIVAGNAKGVREVVTPGTGVLCAPRDAGAYASCLADLIDDPSLAARMGQQARRHAEQEFDTVANNRKLAHLYDELLSTVAPTGMRNAA